MLLTWALRTVGVIGVLVAAVYGVGWLLPRTHVAILEGRVSRPPAEVAATIRDVRAYPGWRRGLTVEQVVEGADGVTYAEVADDRIAYRLTEPARDRQFVTTIVDQSLPFGGYWTITVTPDGSGTRVRIQEDGEIHDPLYRVFARFVFGYTASLERYLQDLGAVDITPAGH